MVDEVRGAEATGSLGGPATVSAIRSGLAAIDRANTRADAAELRVGTLERANYHLQGALEVEHARIAALVTECRVRALETREARRDRWWVIAICAVTMVLGFALILALVWATGPR